MTPAVRALRSVLYDLRLDLANARTRLSEIPADELEHRLPVLDRELGTLQQSLEYCRRYAMLFREPRLRHYDVASYMKERSGQLSQAAFRMVVEGGIEVEGDNEMTYECLRLIRDNARLGKDGGITTELYAKEGAPYFRMWISGAGSFGPEYTLGDRLSLSLDRVQDRWTAATDGGSLDPDEDGFILTLGGDRPVRSAERLSRATVSAVGKAGRRLQPWRGAFGVYEPGYASPEESVELYKNALAACEQHMDEALAGLG